MATSGQINTNTTYDSYFWVKWSMADQLVAENKTRISWSCGVYCGHSFYSNAIKMSGFTINGVQVYSGGTYSNYSKGDHAIASGTMLLPHDNAGNKTFSVSSFTGWLYENNNYSASGKSYDLPAIPRQATITSAPDFTDRDLPTITYSNPAGNNVELLELCICDTAGQKVYVPYRSINKTGTLSHTFTAEDVNKLKNITVNSLKVWFLIRTRIGGVDLWHHEERTFTVTDNADTKPTVNMNVSLNNGTLPSAFNGLYVQGKSKVDVTLTATGKYNADIKSYSAVVDGKTYSTDKFTSDVIQTPGSVKVTGYAKDARGFTGSKEQTINVIEYSKPLVIPLGSENAIQCYRSDDNGNKTNNSVLLWIKAKMSWHNVNGKNACSLQVRSKKSTEEWNQDHEWEYLLDRGYTTSEYNALYDSGPEFALATSYTVQIRAIDDVGEYDIKTFEIPTRDVALHLGKGGKNVAVGTYCDYSEEHTFYSEWKAIFDKDVVVGGNILIGENKTTLRDYILSIMNGG